MELNSVELSILEESKKFNLFSYIKDILESDDTDKIADLLRVMPEREFSNLDPYRETGGKFGCQTWSAFNERMYYHLLRHFGSSKYLEINFIVLENKVKRLADLYKDLNQGTVGEFIKFTNKPIDSPKAINVVFVNENSSSQVNKYNKFDKVGKVFFTFDFSDEGGIDLPQRMSLYYPGAKDDDYVEISDCEYGDEGGYMYE